MQRAFQRAFLLICFLPLFLFSLEIERDDEDPDIVVLPRTAVLNQDFYTYGKSVEVSGTVNGDVYVFGGQIFIDGVVNGDVLIAGGSVEISGKVSQDVRVLAGQALISGHIGRNITALTATIEYAPSATIGGNSLILSGNVDLKSSVAGNVRVYASNLRVSDEIAGKLLAHVGQMRITSRAKIGDGVEYWSNKEALIDHHAQIQEVIHHPSFFYHFFHGKFFKSLKIGSKFAAFMMNFFYTLVIALVLMRYFPQRIDRTMEELTQKPLQSFVAGLVLVVLLPLTFLALLITIVGVPFALTLLAINVVGFYSAKIITIMWGAKYLFIHYDFSKHRRIYFTFALILYYLLTLIPYFGTVVSVAALLFGLGGLVLGKVDRRDKPKKITA